MKIQLSAVKSDFKEIRQFKRKDPTLRNIKLIYAGEAAVNMK